MAFHAGEEGHTTATEETTTAGDLGRGQATADQGVYEPVTVGAPAMIRTSFRLLAPARSSCWVQQV